MTDDTMRIRPVGESALLVEVPDARAAVELYGRLRQDAPEWVVELVPAACTVLLVFDRERSGRTRAAAWLADAAAAAAAAAADDVNALSQALTRRSIEPMQIRLRYDGPDLTEVAQTLGVDTDEVIRLHTEQIWTSAFIGFAPGFAYLVGEHVQLAVPRRATPRAVVPAGSVALAAGYCGIYPRASPGGWHLIGTADALLWDAAATPPALLAPGTRVRFVREQ